MVRAVDPETRVIYATADAMGVPASSILSASRSKRIARARHVACWLLRRGLHLSAREIARAVGRLDHTTAGDSVAIVDRWLTEADPANDLIAGLCTELGFPPPVGLAQAG